jgi:hypothetical protein
VGGERRLGQTQGRTLPGLNRLGSIASQAVDKAKPVQTRRLLRVFP